MKLSVAMCTYNGETHVGEQLESIAAQTRLPDELVVCDDHSSDDTVAIVESFATRSPFAVRLKVNERNLGSTKNFQQAVALCTGEVIFLSDQDDVWHAEKLARFEEEFKDHATAGIVFSDGDVVDEELKPLDRRVWELIRFGGRERRLFSRGKAFDVLLDHNVATGAALAFRAQFRELILPIPDDLQHDGIGVLHDWWAALLIAAVSDVVFIDEPLFRYRQHAGQQLGVLSALNPEGNAETSSIASAARRKNLFSGEIQYLRVIRERLTSPAAQNVRPGPFARLDQRLAHLERRASLPAQRLGRVPIVLGELLSLRYHLYSNGVSSAVKDLLL